MQKLSILNEINCACPKVKRDSFYLIYPIQHMTKAPSVNQKMNALFEVSVLVDNRVIP